jgi:hypothetical protein
MAYKKKYDVDIVLVIDATAGMSGCIQIVRTNAMKLYDDIAEKMRVTYREIHDMRIKVIAFRDYREYLWDHQPPMMRTPFFHMPEDKAKFQKAVDSIEAVGGGDDPEDALEALAFAIRSDWAPQQQGIDRRQIIALWTDAPAHELGYGKSVDIYPKEMAKSFSELTSWWGELDEEAIARQEATGKAYVSYESKRLLLYAPEEEPWSTIARGWKNVIHVPTERDQYNRVLNDLAVSEQYAEIVNLLVKTIA